MGEKQRTERTFAGSLHVQGTATGVPKVDRLALTASDTAGAIFNWMIGIRSGPGGPDHHRRRDARHECLFDFRWYRSVDPVGQPDRYPRRPFRRGRVRQPQQSRLRRKTSQLVAARNYLTGSKASGATAGLVGQAYIEYIRLY